MTLIDTIKNNDVVNAKSLLDSEDTLNPDLLRDNHELREAFQGACANGNLEMVALLFANNKFRFYLTETDEQKLNTLNSSLLAAMRTAHEKGDTAMVKLLFQGMDDVKSWGFLGLPVSRYIDPNSPDILQEIADLEEHPFSYIEKKGNLGEASLTDAVKMLLNSPGADPTTANLYYALFFSPAEDGYLEVFKLLWEDQRVRLTLDDNKLKSLMNSTIFSGHLKIFKLLWEDQRVQFILNNNLFQSLMMTATSSGHQEIVSFLKAYEHELDEKLSPQARLQKQLKALNVTNDPFEFKERLITLLPSVYENRYREFDGLIITDLPGATKDNPNVDIFAFTPSRQIYNLDRYDEGLNILEGPYRTKGSPLATEEDIPISYVAYLPQGEVKSVLVQVYGGGNAASKTKYLCIPTRISGVDAKLLQQGVAIIKLNLIDLLAGHYSQFEMGQALHEKLHQSIHTFYEVIKNHPEKLHASLAVLKDKPLTLKGSSFGGRTAVKHAELYPQTFDYYISFDGVLSPEMLRKSDIMAGFGSSYFRYNTNSAMQGEAWSSPVNGIENIKDPILLVHNVNDNNVNLKVTIDWYKKADAAGKSPLVRMLIMDKGSPSYEGPHNTGHGLATDVKSVERLSYLITQFATEGPSNLPEYTNWVGYKYEMVANQNYRSASVEESFIAQAHRLYRKANSEMPSDETLSNIYYTFLYLHSIFPMNLSDDLNRLDRSGLLTDEVLTQGLQLHLKMFLNYLKESENLTEMPSDLNINELITKPLLEKYKAALFDLPRELFKRSPLLTSLFLANPSLVQKVSKYHLDPLNQQEMERAKANFSAAIKEEKQLIRSLWRAAARESLQQEKKDRKALRLGQAVVHSKRNKSPSSSPSESVGPTPAGKKPRKRQ